VSGGTIYTLDHVLSTGSSSDWAGIVSFVPGVSSAEGTHVTDPSAFYYPSGLAVVPSRTASRSAAASFLSLASLSAPAHSAQFVNPRFAGGSVGAAIGCKHHGPQRGRRAACSPPRRLRV